MPSKIKSYQIIDKLQAVFFRFFCSSFSQASFTYIVKLNRLSTFPQILIARLRILRLLATPPLPLLNIGPFTANAAVKVVSAIFAATFVVGKSVYRLVWSTFANRGRTHTHIVVVDAVVTTQSVHGKREIRKKNNPTWHVNEKKIPSVLTTTITPAPLESVANLCCCETIRAVFGQPVCKNGRARQRAR